MKKVQIYAQYCDDIIQHANAPKHTVVGIHAGSLLVENFPALIPKLGINVTMLFPSEDNRIFSEKFTLEIIKNSDVIISAEIEPFDRNQIFESNNHNFKDDDDLEITGNLQNIISSLQIEEKTKIYAQLKFNDEIIKSNSLRIISAH